MIITLIHYIIVLVIEISKIKKETQPFLFQKLYLLFGQAGLVYVIKKIERQFFVDTVVIKLYYY